MAQYIDKNDLVKAIDRQKIGYNVDGKHTVEHDITRKILDIINALEVKEVDLDSNIRAYLTNHFNVYEDGILQSKKSSQPLSTYDIIKVAKHFFELGINTQQNISIDLTDIDKVIEENGVDPNSKEAKMFKESYYMALEKLKTQKGE